MYKWFGLELPPPCGMCEILRYQLDESNKERKEYLARLLAFKSEPVLPEKTEEYRPLQPQFIPWRVRQQMLEEQDRHKARLMKDKEKEMQEVSDLEKELIPSE
jgi:hypothetical protein